VYPLLPWKWLSGLLVLAIAIAVYVDDLGQWLGVSVPDTLVIRLLPLILLGVFTGFFRPTGYYAPWRIVWRLIPSLNRWFPDLNGVWVGTTNSNWPTVKKFVEMALSTERVTEKDLHDTPEQRDAMAVQITNSLFTLKIAAVLSSNDGEAHSITAKPWRHQHTDRIHISYVYEQHTPNHSATDEETHLGAADLALTMEKISKVSGTYWTRRNWRTGRNTAGTLELSRLEPRKAKNMSLRDYAAAHKAKITNPGASPQP
jgi:hypothetical protein